MLKKVSFHLAWNKKIDSLINRMLFNRFSRAIEDTGSIISDYTEDDIDVPNDEEDHYEQHNQNMISPDFQYKNQMPPNPVVASTASLPAAPHQHRRSNGTKRNQRQSASLTRTVENREKKRSRTRSNDIPKDLINATNEITTITTMKMDDDGRPLTVTSEIQHGHSESLKIQSQSNQMNKDGSVVELSFVPPRVKGKRKKRPSREFLQRSADDSEITEDSEIFWNEEIVEEISNTQQVPSTTPIHVMTPIIEAPTPTNNRSQSNFKTGGGQGTPGLSKIMANQSKGFSASGSIPLARKYKRSHLFKAQVILNSEYCAHCDKRNKFGKMIMKCRECDLVVHTECKDMLQRPCYPAFNFPNQGKFVIFILFHEWLN